jgi:hypothetical protein
VFGELVVIFFKHHADVLNAVIVASEIFVMNNFISVELSANEHLCNYTVLIKPSAINPDSHVAFIVGEITFVLIQAFADLVVAHRFLALSS